MSASAGLTGLEWSFGIPGSIGGAVRGNAGCYGSDMSKCVNEVEVYDLTKKKFIKFKNKDCAFKYRDSIFKKNKNMLIVGIKLKLSKGARKNIKILSQKNFDHRFHSNPKRTKRRLCFLKM